MMAFRVIGRKWRRRWYNILKAAIQRQKGTCHLPLGSYCLKQLQKAVLYGGEVLGERDEKATAVFRKKVKYLGDVDDDGT